MNRCLNGTKLPLSAIAALLLAGNVFAADTNPPSVIVNTSSEPVAAGKFQPSWESLRQYQTPTWFRDAKFGIWAHWGPQCQPEDGDWYARSMYLTGSGQYRFRQAVVVIFRSAGD